MLAERLPASFCISWHLSPLAWRHKLWILAQEQPDIFCSHSSSQFGASIPALIGSESTETFSYCEETIAAEGKDPGPRYRLHCNEQTLAQMCGFSTNLQSHLQFGWHFCAGRTHLNGTGYELCGSKDNPALKWHTFEPHSERFKPLKGVN